MKSNFNTSLNSDLASELNSTNNNFNLRRIKKLKKSETHPSMSKVPEIHSYGHKRKKLNEESIQSYINQLKLIKEDAELEHKIRKENINETSIHTPKQVQAKSNSDVLWIDINQKLGQNAHLDEDELIEMRQNLEKMKREALLKDILNSNKKPHRDEDEIQDDSNFEQAVKLEPELDMRVDPENNKCLDSVVEETTARKKFMQICCEEFNRSPDFHYFKH